MGDRHLASVAEREVVTDHVPWRDPCSGTRWDATLASAAEGADAATPARIAVECNRASGQELTEEEGNSHGGVASAAKEGERND